MTLVRKSSAWVAAALTLGLVAGSSVRAQDANPSPILQLLALPSIAPATITIQASSPTNGVPAQTPVAASAPLVFFN